MRKILLFLLFFTYSNHLYSKELTVKGYPTSVQINDNKTLTLMMIINFHSSVLLMMEKLE